MCLPSFKLKCLNFRNRPDNISDKVLLTVQPHVGAVTCCMMSLVEGKEVVVTSGVDNNVKVGSIVERRIPVL